MQTSLDYTFSKALEDLNRLQEDLTKDTRIQLHDEQGAIIGEALLRDYLDGDIFLADFEIFPEYRGQGFGTQQLYKLINDYGVNCLCVGTTNRRAKHMYDKAGFKVVGKPYYDKNAQERVYYMRLEN